MPSSGEPPNFFPSRYTSAVSEARRLSRPSAGALGGGLEGMGTAASGGLAAGAAGSAGAGLGGVVGAGGVVAAGGGAGGVLGAGAGAGGGGDLGCEGSAAGAGSGAGLTGAAMALGSGGAGFAAGAGAAAGVDAADEGKLGNARSDNSTAARARSGRAIPPSVKAMPKNPVPATANSPMSIHLTTATDDLPKKELESCGRPKQAKAFPSHQDHIGAPCGNPPLRTSAGGGPRALSGIPGLPRWPGAAKAAAGAKAGEPGEPGSPQEPRPLGGWALLPFGSGGTGLGRIDAPVEALGHGAWVVGALDGADVCSPMVAGSTIGGRQASSPRCWARLAGLAGPVWRRADWNAGPVAPALGSQFL